MGHPESSGPFPTALLLALVVLYSGRRHLGAVDEPETFEEQDQVIVEELQTAAV